MEHIKRRKFLLLLMTVLLLAFAWYCISHAYGSGNETAGTLVQALRARV